jgi:hypothetical protein
MDQLFWIVILVAVLLGVFCAWGPKAMLAVIAVPAALVVVFFVVMFIRDDREHEAIKKRNLEQSKLNPFSDNYDPPDALRCLAPPGGDWYQANVSYDQCRRDGGTRQDGRAVGHSTPVPRIWTPRRE